jgi:hypothetical protein
VSTDRLVIDDQSGVSRVLQQGPQLASLIREAVSALGSFIPDARLKLEVLADPDYGEGEQLFIGVATELPKDQALDALHRFDQQWWVHNVGRARGRLCIDLSES